MQIIKRGRNGSLKKLSRGLDRFCARHPNFGVPNLMLYLVAVNAIVFLVWMMDRSGMLLGYLQFDLTQIFRGEVWRIVSFLFLPFSGQIIFEIIAISFYYYIGQTLERLWGTARFTIYYLSGTVLLILYAAVLGLLGHPEAGWALNGHYINVSLFLTFSLLFPDVEFRIYFIIPVKSKWLGLLELIFFVISMIQLPLAAKPIPLLALLPVAVFSWSSVLRLLRPLKRSERKTRNNVIRFRSAARAAEQEIASRPYQHRCEVCGRTDVDHPELEFRYCSRCAGYHCFCQDHISNHRHFTE